jgi:glycosyltransferase involved in cell wall biosynthesis
METVAILVTILGKGGISRSAIELESMISKKFDTKVIFFNSQEEANVTPKSGHLLSVHPPKSLWHKAYVMLRRYNLLKSFYNNKIPSNTISFDPSCALVSWLAFRKKRKIRMIAMCHVPISLLSWSDRFIIKWIYPKMETVVVPSHYLKRELLSLTSELNLKVIPNILPEYFSHCSITEQTRNHKKSYVFVGRLEKEKNPFLFLRMAAQDQTNAYVVHGSGSLENDCRKYVESNEIKNVEFRGYTTDENPYLNAKVLVVPSLTESFGIVALEAWSQGVPILVSDSSHGIVEMMFDFQQGEVVQLDQDVNYWLSALKRVENINMSDEVITRIVSMYNSNTISNLWSNELL